MEKIIDVTERLKLKKQRENFYRALDKIVAEGGLAGVVFDNEVFCDGCFAFTLLSKEDVDQNREDPNPYICSKCKKKL